MTVNAVVVPSVSISANPGSTICAGTSVTFTAVPTNGGASPSYQWKVNGVNAGTNISTFTTTTLTNGQIVTCVLTSNAVCASPTTATSNSITMTVVSGLASVTSVTPSSGSIGTSITIKGVRFATATSVQIGSGSTSSITVSGDTMIVMNVPSGSTNGIVRITNICGTNVSGPTYTVTSTTVSLSLTFLIEGYYSSGTSMTPVLFNLGLNPTSTACDSVTVQLRLSASPGVVAFSASGIVNASGNISLSYPSSVSGNSYYIVVLHRNAVQTWSNAVNFTTVTSYNFNSAASQAFGSNLIAVAPGVFAFYSGDIATQDEVVDISDQGLVGNDILNFSAGYVPTDVSGDGVVDITDQAIVDNNIINFVGSIHP